MIWFSPERELHLHKLSWHPRENSEEEISPGPDSFTSRPSHQFRASARGPVGLSGKPVCAQSTQQGHSSPVPSRPQIITSGQHTCDPSDGGHPGRTKGRLVALENPRTRATRPLSTARTSTAHISQPCTHSYLCLLTKCPGAVGPEEAESTECPAQALLSGLCELGTITSAEATGTAERLVWLRLCWYLCSYLGNDPRSKKHYTLSSLKCFTVPKWSKLLENKILKSQISV